MLLLFMKQLVKNWRIFIKNMQFHKQLIVMSKLCQFYTMSSGNILSILKPIFVYLSKIFLGHLDQTNCGSIWSHVRYTWHYTLTLDMVRHESSQDLQSGWCCTLIIGISLPWWIISYFNGHFTGDMYHF